MVYACSVSTIVASALFLAASPAPGGFDSPCAPVIETLSAFSNQEVGRGAERNESADTAFYGEWLSRLLQHADTIRLCPEYQDSWYRRTVSAAQLSGHFDMAIAMSYEAEALEQEDGRKLHWALTTPLIAHSAYRSTNDAAYLEQFESLVDVAVQKVATIGQDTLDGPSLQMYIDLRLRGVQLIDQREGTEAALAAARDIYNLLSDDVPAQGVVTAGIGVDRIIELIARNFLRAGDYEAAAEWLRRMDSAEQQNRSAQVIFSLAQRAGVSPRVRAAFLDTWIDDAPRNKGLVPLVLLLGSTTYQGHFDLDFVQVALERIRDLDGALIDAADADAEERFVRHGIAPNGDPTEHYRASLMSMEFFLLYKLRRFDEALPIGLEYLDRYRSRQNAASIASFLERIERRNR